jgi:hypothetical protein
MASAKEKPSRDSQNDNDVLAELLRVIKQLETAEQEELLEYAKKHVDRKKRPQQ